MVFWPPFSPDLNPIETCWDWMKDYVGDKWGLEELPSYDNLRKYVKEVWDALPDSFWQELLASMPAWCQGQLRQIGMHTKY
jgi:hypothetical protein